MACATDEALDRVGGTQRAPQRIGEAERQDGERFLQAFAEAVRGTRMTAFQAPGQILQQPCRRRDVGVAVRALQDRLDPRSLTLGQMVEDIAKLVKLTALDE